MHAADPTTLGHYKCKNPLYLQIHNAPIQSIYKMTQSMPELLLRASHVMYSCNIY